MFTLGDLVLVVRAGPGERDSKHLSRRQRLQPPQIVRVAKRVDFDVEDKRQVQVVVAVAGPILEVVTDGHQQVGAGLGRIGHQLTDPERASRQKRVV